MCESVISEIRQLLVEEVSPPLKLLAMKVEGFQLELELWTRSTEERLASFEQEQAQRRAAR